MPVKNQYLYLVFLLPLAFSCNTKSDDNPAPVKDSLAVVKTDSASLISFSSARIYYAMHSAGKPGPSAFGLVYGVSPNPTLADNVHNASSVGTGRYSSDLLDLLSGTTYYVRSYATNTVGTAYSPQLSFTTLAGTVPIVTTASVDTISYLTAKGGGGVTNQSSGPITQRGICYSASPNPTTASSKVTTGPGSGNFRVALTSLEYGTRYYVRAFATNDAGTGYGPEVSFTTLADPRPKDADGNRYDTVRIGGQVWLKQNLKTTHYNNGDLIPTGISASDWLITTIGAFAVYDGDPANNDAFGKLYNWFAVADSRGLCPAGYHMPTYSEYDVLATAVGGLASGGKLKAVSNLWNTPNTGATDASGFSALPGGYRYYDDVALQDYLDKGKTAALWTITPESGTFTAWQGQLYSHTGGLSLVTFRKEAGAAIRCLKD